MEEEEEAVEENGALVGEKAKMLGAIFGGGAATPPKGVEGGAANGATTRGENHCLRRGPVEKLSRGGQSWKPRDLVLGTQHLWYAKTATAEQNGTTPPGSLNHGKTSVAAKCLFLKELDRVLEGREKLGFDVVSRWRTLSFRARTVRERDAWILAIAGQTALVKENDLLLQADRVICKAEYHVATTQQNLVASFRTLDGLLRCREARELFTDFIRQEYEESLMQALLDDDGNRNLTGEEEEGGVHRQLLARVDHQQRHRTTSSAFSSSSPSSQSFERLRKEAPVWPPGKNCEDLLGYLDWRRHRRPARQKNSPPEGICSSPSRSHLTEDQKDPEGGVGTDEDAEDQLVDQLLEEAAAAGCLGTDEAAGGPRALPPRALSAFSCTAPGLREGGQQGDDENDNKESPRAREEEVGATGDVTRLRELVEGYLFPKFEQDEVFQHSLALLVCERASRGFSQAGLSSSQSPITTYGKAGGS